MIFQSHFEALTLALRPPWPWITYDAEHDVQISPFNYGPYTILALQGTDADYDRNRKILRVSLADVWTDLQLWKARSGFPAGIHHLAGIIKKAVEEFRPHAAIGWSLGGMEAEFALSLGVKECYSYGAPRIYPNGLTIPDGCRAWNVVLRSDALIPAYPKAWYRRPGTEIHVGEAKPSLMEHNCYRYLDEIRRAGI